MRLKEITQEMNTVQLTTIIEASEPDHRRFILAVFNLSVKMDQKKISRRLTEERLKEPRTRFNNLFHYWLKLGLVEADKFDIWLTCDGIIAIEQYRARKES